MLKACPKGINGGLPLPQPLFEVKSPAAGETGLKDVLVADVARFAARAAERFKFLHPSVIKDAAGKRPGDPEYDPRTLYIPPNWAKEYKVSEGQRQWYVLPSSCYEMSALSGLQISWFADCRGVGVRGIQVRSRHKWILCVRASQASLSILVLHCLAMV